MSKDVLKTRRKSLEVGLNPNTRRKMADLENRGILNKSNGSGIRTAQKAVMSKKLNQRLKYRPNRGDLVKCGILRPGAGGQNTSGMRK